jgi:hypothetical protein
MRYANKVIPYRLKRSKSPDKPLPLHPYIRIANRYVGYISTALSDHNYASPYKPCIVYAESVNPNPNRQMFKTYNQATEITYKDLKYIRQPYGGNVLPLDLLMNLPLCESNLKFKDYSHSEFIDIVWHQYNVTLNILHGIDQKNLSELLPPEILPILKLSSREKVSLVNYLEDLSKIIDLSAHQSHQSPKPKPTKTYSTKEVLKILQLDTPVPNLGKSSYTIHKYILKLDSFLMSLIDGKHFVIHLI